MGWGVTGRAEWECGDSGEYGSTGLSRGPLEVNPPVGMRGVGSALANAAAGRSAGIQWCASISGTDMCYRPVPRAQGTAESCPRSFSGFSSPLFGPAVVPFRASCFPVGCLPSRDAPQPATRAGRSGWAAPFRDHDRPPHAHRRRIAGGTLRERPAAAPRPLPGRTRRPSTAAPRGTGSLSDSSGILPLAPRAPRSSRTRPPPKTSPRRPSTCSSS